MGWWAAIPYIAKALQGNQANNDQNTGGFTASPAPVQQAAPMQAQTTTPNLNRFMAQNPETIDDEMKQRMMR
jgi:hypothetical protein